MELFQPVFPKIINAVDYSQFAKDLSNNFKAAKNGILFIDNAHKLVPSGYTGGQITQLDKLYSEMESNPYDPIVVLAGLPEGFRDYIEANPDVKNKFHFIFYLPDLSANDMLLLAKQEFKNQKFTLSSDAETKLQKLLKQFVKTRDRTFGNGHLVIKIVEEIIQNYYLRIKGSVSDEVILPDDIKTEIKAERTTEEIFLELDKMIGLDDVKKYIRNMIDLIEVKKKDAEQSGKKYALGEHLVFLGNPGTGKTTLARKLGEIFSSIGLLDRGHIIEVDRSKMVGQYVGETAKIVQKLCDDAIGGILFIDEAYTLKQHDNDNFGQESIDTLLKRMEDDRGKFMVIAAGYQKEMQSFITSNPGLKSRFKEENFFLLKDYTPDQLLEIFKKFAEGDKYIIDEAAIEKLQKVIELMYEKRDKNFGNGREVRNLFEKCLSIRATRLKKARIHEMIIRPDDIPKTSEEGKQLSLEETLDELNKLTGLGAVKKEITNLINYLEVEKMRSVDGGKKTSLNIHFIFKGNPGTGKTTVARILANIFKAMGLLPKGHLIETDRKDLVAGYVGQTASQTTRIIDSAMGGVLFIDEAYTLASGSGNDFGKEAIDTLLKRMEDDKGKFIVIAAGYSGDMDRFLDSNPGLTSRFSKHIIFDDYIPEEMTEIFKGMVKQKGMKIDDGVEEFVLQLFTDIFNKRDKNFANGRTVRNIFEGVLQNQAARIVAEKRKGNDITSIINTISISDFSTS